MVVVERGGNSTGDQQTSSNIIYDLRGFFFEGRDLNVAAPAICSSQQFYGVNIIAMNEALKSLERAEEVFLRFVADIETGKFSDIAIRRALKKYDVKNLKINNVTPLRAKKMYSSILPKYESGATTDKNWLENERRLFVWCTICYLYKHATQVAQMKNEDFEFMQSMFPLKDIDLIKFQINSLIKKDNKNSSWTIKQDSTLLKVILARETGDLEWSSISKEFFAATQEQYFRNAKQCRERWLNHLDPKKTKGKWLKEQDRILLEEVLNRGKKWSQIVIALQGKKNEHMIKNRYKSLLHKKQKALQNRKIKQNELIKMILLDLEDQPDDEPSQNNEQLLKKEKIDEQDEEESLSGNNEKIEEEENQQEQKPEEKELIFDECYPKWEPEKRMKAAGNQAKDQGAWNSNSNKLPIIVDPANKKMTPMQGPMDISRNFDEENVRNEVEIYGNRNDMDMHELLFQNASTPGVGQNNSRYPPLNLESRSPANIFVSPYPSVWTPTIVFMEGHQVDSPLASFDTFKERFKSFNKFVKDENLEE